MKKKFRQLLSDKCKDMGLTEKAIDSLVELGANGLKDDSSDEDVTKAVDFVVPYAKAMQAEITRKTRKPQSNSSQSQGEGEGEGEQNKGGNADAPDWFKPFQEKLTALEQENATLKAEKSKGEREAKIAAKAKSLGIPDYLMKRYTLAEDADIDKELEAFKQDLVNNNLMPKGQTHETGTTMDAMKADAKSWASSLPDA